MTIPPAEFNVTNENPSSHLTIPYSSNHHHIIPPSSYLLITNLFFSLYLFIEFRMLTNRRRHKSYSERGRKEERGDSGVPIFFPPCFGLCGFREERGERRGEERRGERVIAKWKYPIYPVFCFWFGLVCVVFGQTK
ncbi:hypothetical protein F4778DRAFT_351264 [Xylariomycetidae sp. FL2044]|nr:hypothetical protein F4778DRAFT_351264 [Xylariomycetidae sp. FL2044]